MRFLAVVVVLASCANVDDFPEPLVSVTPTADMGFTAVGPRYAMTFAGGTKLHLPSRLEIDGKDRLGTDSCSLESQLGVAMFPGATATSEVTGTSTIMEVLNGPFIGRVRSTYEVPYACQGPQVLKGEVIYTFFPNGRIVRQDVNVFPSSMDLNNVPGPCGCGSIPGTPDSANFFFTSFWAFDPSQNPRLFDEIGMEVQNPLTRGVPGGSRACTQYLDVALGVGWPATTTRLYQNQAASHIFDWPPQGASMLVTGPQSVTSALTIATSCQEALANLDDPQLFIDNVLMSTGEDGIYHDARVHDSSFEIHPGAGTIPSGFTIEVDFGRPVSRIFLERSPGVDHRVALVQASEANRFFIIFQDQLDPGQTITIDPQ